MSGFESLIAEISWMRRRGLAAAPASHPLRSPDCPPLGALARGGLSGAQRRHVAECRHCRAIRAASADPSLLAVAPYGALAAVLAIGVWLTGWRQPVPERFSVPAVEVAAPSPRAVEAVWPAPLRLQAPDSPLPAPRALPPLPVIRPLERFHPPERFMELTPMAVLGGPMPPALDPAPPPDVVGMLGLRVL